MHAGRHINARTELFSSLKIWRQALTATSGKPVLPPGRRNRAPDIGSPPRAHHHQPRCQTAHKAPLDAEIPTDKNGAEHVFPALLKLGPMPSHHAPVRVGMPEESHFIDIFSGTWLVFCFLPRSNRMHRAALSTHP